MEDPLETITLSAGAAVLGHEDLRGPSSTGAPPQVLRAPVGVYEARGPSEVAVLLGVVMAHLVRPVLLLPEDRRDQHDGQKGIRSREVGGGWLVGDDLSGEPFGWGSPFVGHPRVKKRGMGAIKTW